MGKNIRNVQTVFAIKKLSVGQMVEILKGIADSTQMNQLAELLA